jgi:EAL domain-containing protein (putative c-di-GMP-specific phosphodiesterase class I)
LSELKIDASFVRALDTNPQSNAVVASIIALGGALGLDVVAEGVETEDQRRRLDQMGCPYMQGYLFSRPLLPDDLSKWAQDWVGPVAPSGDVRSA